MNELFGHNDCANSTHRLNINSILTAVCKNKNILHQTAVELCTDDEELEKFLVNNIFVTDEHVSVSCDKNSCKKESAKSEVLKHKTDKDDAHEESVTIEPGIYTSAVLNTDGGSRGNPGVAGCGVVIQYEDGPKIGYYEYLGLATNNEAEYSGLIKGLTVLKEMKVRKVVAFADSELMCNQINGLYQVKSAVLKPYFNKAKELIETFESFSITHVLRNKNKDADRMANKAMDLKKNGEARLTVVE